ncbi:MAG: hypothetical protein OXF97_07530 [Nitrospira sp.]|nr:hypothetical protein [Nitrospira sp.]MCY3954534.1 hypothetical protein [Nitrospira sp.]MCY4132424.1 hypothetical protein [Nitrospira sp.]
MSYSRFRKRLEALLAFADVRVDGGRPWDILLCAAGGFRARVNQVWQIVFSANGVREGYSPADIR